MDEVIGINTTSPSINYLFMLDLLPNYNQLKDNFVNGTVSLTKNVGWRDDMKFLHHLVEVFKFYKEKQYFPMVRFNKLPNISNARWNSRAILALLSYILIPDTRQFFERICQFMCYHWAKAGSQMKAG